MRICLFTDGPPLLDNAHGNHGVARIFLRALGEGIPLVITHRYRRTFSRQDIREASQSAKVFFYMDSSATGMRRFMPVVATIMDAILFAASLPGILFHLRKNRIDRVFVLAGADAWFLLHIWFLQLVGIETETYFVDDIEESAKHGHNRYARSWVKRVWAAVIRRSSKVYAICSGFAEHLNERFGCNAEFLPLPSESPPPSVASPGPKAGELRHIVFIGGLNHLYLDALHDLYAAICELNAGNESGYKLVLEIISYSDVAAFAKGLPNQDWLVTHHRLPDEEMHKHLREAYACFLPYSFKPEERLMVSTSFSCKILEYYTSGRPILVYGPEYASIPRFFLEEKLPLVATSRSELPTVLGEIERHQAQDLVAEYRRVWEKYHSPNAIKDILFGVSNL